MKKIVLLILSITILLCFVACEQGHTHSFGEWEVTKNATCTKDGVKTRYCDCGEMQSNTISAAGHVRQTIPAVPATCFKTGLTSGVKCANCNTILIGQSATYTLAHTYDDIYDDKCNVCGYKRAKTYPKLTNIVMPEKGTCFAHGDTLELRFNIQDCSVLPEKISIGASSHYEKDGSSWSGTGSIVFNLNKITGLYELDYCYDTFVNAQLIYTDEYTFILTADFTTTQNIRQAGYHSLRIYHDNWSEKDISIKLDNKYVVNDNCAIGKHTIENGYEMIFPSTHTCSICGNTVTIASSESVICKIYPKITNIVMPEQGTCFSHGDTLELRFNIQDCSVLPKRILIIASSKYEKDGHSYSGIGGIAFNLNEDTGLYELDYCYDTFVNAQLTYTDEYIFIMTADFTTTQNIRQAGYNSITIYHDNWSEKEISIKLDNKYVFNDYLQ